MELERKQRIFHGDLSPDDLAEHLVRHYDPQPNLHAQEIGEEHAHVVQIGHGDDPEKSRQAITVAITPAPEGQEGLAVSVGQQSWLTPALISSTAILAAAIKALSKQSSLLALLLPITVGFLRDHLVDDVWNTIDNYVVTKGGALGETTVLA